MEIVNLDVGKAAPSDSDCISIDRRADGRYSLTGSVLSGDESIAMVGGDPYDTHEQAESEGLAWASENGVALLYVASNRDGS